MTNQHKYTPLIDGIENGRLNLRDVQKILEEWREGDRETMSNKHMNLFKRFMIWTGYRSKCCYAKTYVPHNWNRLYCCKCGKRI